MIFGFMSLHFSEHWHLIVCSSLEKSASVKQINLFIPNEKLIKFTFCRELQFKPEKIKYDNGHPEMSASCTELPWLEAFHKYIHMA